MNVTVKTSLYREVVSDSLCFHEDATEWRMLGKSPMGVLGLQLQVSWMQTHVEATSPSFLSLDYSFTPSQYKRAALA